MEENKLEGKFCNECGEFKTLDQFYKQKKHSKNKGEYIYYNPECKDCTSKRAVKWQKKNPDKRKEHLKRINASSHKKKMVREAWKLKRKRGDQRERQRKNPDKIKKYSLNRRNKTHRITNEEWINCKNYFNNSCAYCGMTYDEHKLNYNQDLHKEHVEHNGSNQIDNCVPSCKSCNSEKHTYTLSEWYNKENPKFNEKRLQDIFNWIENGHKLIK